MATASTNTNTNDNQNQQQQQGPNQRVIGSPITNQAYNVITAIQAKLEGLEAYSKYAKDGDQQLWQRLTESDAQNVETLVGQLEQLVRNGQLRPQNGGGETENGRNGR